MSSTPQHFPTQRELDDLELLVTGAYAPLTGFNELGSPVTLEIPAELAKFEIVELLDPEGVPLATVDHEGNVTHLAHAEYGPFRRLYLSPSRTREQHAGATFVPVNDALTQAELDELPKGRIVFLALVGAGTPRGMSPVDLIRTTLAAADLLEDASVVAVPFPSHDNPTADHLLGAQTVENFAVGDPVLPLLSPPVVEQRGTISPRVVEQSRPQGTPVVEQSRPQGTPVVEQRGTSDQSRPQGLAIFFTGLSGSGKSTIARALEETFLEQGKTVTSLDGDVVRRNLSAGLTFSKEDRETNIRRIGWVAAEISRHGGIAICSPIAPFDETRQQVRTMVEEAGGRFVLVHVATPLVECERRDRKGLYAKARAGEIPEFTGISSPYEEPEDAELRVDTTGRTLDEVLDEVLDILG